MRSLGTVPRLPELSRRSGLLSRGIRQQGSAASGDDPFPIITLWRCHEHGSKGDRNGGKQGSRLNSSIRGGGPDTLATVKA